MSKKAVPLYCFDWHLNQSPAQDEILIKPLSAYIEFDAVPWDGIHLDLSKETIRSTPLVFFLFPPPPNLLADPEARLVWIPMWDVAKKYRASWWNKLPKSLRVVALSEQIRRKVVTAKLPVLTLKYYKKPDEIQPVVWNDPRKVFYWNRTGLVGKEFLEKLCSALGVDVLFFRRRIDPGWPSWCDYSLPEKLGRTKVQELNFKGAEGYQQYIEHLNQANIFIAPRPFEGVGLSFLEAMAKGCAVFANNASTMNEYIDHKKNGYLLSSDPISEFLLDREKLVQQLYRYRFASRSVEKDVIHPLFRHPIATRQNWKEIARLDLQTLGERARQEQLLGYKVWRDSWDQFASFITDW